MRRAAQMSNTRALRPRRVACAKWPAQSGLCKVARAEWPVQSGLCKAARAEWFVQSGLCRVARAEWPMRRAARFGFCDDLRAAAAQASACRAPAPPWAGIGVRDAGAPSDPNARNTAMGKASGRSIKAR